MEGLVAAIRRRGPIPFSEVVEAGLYGAEGFYTSGGAAGRGGDFLTSPEVGPLFGAVVARALDGWWREMGAPDPFVVVDAGAGPGTLCRSVLAARPACAPALRYVLVEVAEAQREQHRRGLALEQPSHAFAPDHDEDDDDTASARRSDQPVGPIVVSLAALPRFDGPCVVLANELLDNLPFDVYERRTGRWHEVRVGVTDDESTLTEVVVSIADEPIELAGVDAADGVRAPVQRAAAAWVRDALALAKPEGRVVALDYARGTTAELISRPWRDWLRTYRGHQRGADPLADLGRQDITVEVAVDQLPPPTKIRSQAEWLRAHGIDKLVEASRRTWEERAAIGDLEAMKARSRITESQALLDDQGLGAFLVLEWTPETQTGGSR